MSFLTPLALLGAAIVGPIIVAMYLLKLRREERVISSTFLWQRMVRDVEANAPWQKLRRNLLLLLQLLLMLLLVLALARPFLPVTGISGTNLIIIFDRSTSMLATDEPPTRLEAARRQALALIDQLPDNGRATIITIGGQMEAPIAASGDRRELRRIIANIQPSYSTQSDLTQALTLASALAAREPDSEVAIISDGNVTIPDGLRVPARVRYFPIGRASDNVAINAIALQPGPFE
ncbi:MAG: VWA domain-containing protein, partial [Chloroflexi bacterium]